MSNKNKKDQQEKNYWQEMREEGKAKDARAKAFYEDRINELLDLLGIGKGTRDYDLQLVRIAAKNWMYLDRNRDSLRLSGMYYSKYFNPGDEENAIISDSMHVQMVKKYRTILEGLFQALGIPTRMAFECDELKMSKFGKDPRLCKR